MALEDVPIDRDSFPQFPSLSLDWLSDIYDVAKAEADAISEAEQESKDDNQFQSLDPDLF